ncbi:phage tail sheath family protein [Paenibacillus illinoisensis]|uniref:Phage tail sheath family protein n=1 Tax=Paenibacillus illinoisensis TaxID=59845 RepID=A0ABW8HZ55_9BACL
MAGGTWETQNKVIPGTYINFVSEARSLSVVGERGIVTMALPLSWGPAKQLVTLEAGEDYFELLGYDATAPELLLIREALKRARTLILYRLNDGVAATATTGNLVVTAKYSGLRGNAISVVVQTNVDDPSKFDVITLVDGNKQETQIVSDITGLVANDWVTFAAAASDNALATTAGAPLTGGTDGTVTNADHTNYLTAIEVHDFNTIGLVSDDNTLKALYTAFVKRLRDGEGKKVQLVVTNYTTADHEGVISVKNGVILSDQTVIDRIKAVAWVAGATAGAAVNQSLTYSAYDDAVDVDTRYTNGAIETALLNGEFLFIANRGQAVVQQDINTFKSFTPTKGSEFRKNRVLRVLDGIANDTKSVFDRFYIGKVDNNPDGRMLFRAELVSLFNTYQEIGAIQNFDAQTDILVQAGTAKDAVYVEANAQPVDAMEKLYMRVKVK